MFDTLSTADTRAKTICRIKNLKSLQEFKEKLRESELLTLELETIINSSN